jgi:hypothetical protein
MKVSFPGVPPTSYSAAFLGQVLSRISLLFGQVVSSQQEAPCIILSSPNGKLWRVSVSDLGVLVVGAAGPASLAGARGVPPP